MNDADRIDYEARADETTARKKLERDLRQLRTQLNRWLRKGESDWDMGFLMANLEQVRESATATIAARAALGAMRAMRDALEPASEQEEASGGPSQ